MMTALIINLILVNLIVPAINHDDPSSSELNPKPIIVDQERKIAGALEIAGPVRINHQSRGLKLTARSAVVVDTQSGQVLFEKAAQIPRSIASISKLVTALVFLDHNPGWDQIVMIKASDEVGGARLKISNGESLTVKDLFNASLIGSTNNATMALARLTGLQAKDFVIEMNQKAKSLGMKASYFAEATGLNRVNHSTANDVAQLIKAALAEPAISDAINLESYQFQTINTRRWVSIANTDQLLKSFLNNGDGYKILGGKTGYTEEAGFCLGVGAENQQGRQIIAVVLGGESDEARFQEIKGLIWWTFENWRWD